MVLIVPAARLIACEVSGIQGILLLRIFTRVAVHHLRLDRKERKSAVFD
jgi:hypothetical protein